MTIANVSGPDDLRARMVATLLERGSLRSPEVTAAFEAVPRHLVDGVDPVAVYDPYRAVATKWDASGIAVSSVSAPVIQAVQLERAAPRPGERVLEIGSGGVNAAYLADLVGPDGVVVTMDIDPDVTARARAFLAAVGRDRVQVLTADAADGVPGDGVLFDLIMVTVETTDILPAWWEQLAPAGRIVAPIRWRGQRRMVTLYRQGRDAMVSDDPAQAGFVPMQGAGQYRDRTVALRGVPIEAGPPRAGEGPDRWATLRLDDGVDVDAPALTQALLIGPVSLTWTDAVLPADGRCDGLDLWLATVLDDIVMMNGYPLTGLDTGGGLGGLDGVRTAPNPIGWPVLVDGASMVFRVQRCLSNSPADPDTSDSPDGPWQVGVIAYGPDAVGVSERYAGAVRGWEPTATPRLTITRSPLTGPEPVGRPYRSVPRPASTLTISWS